MTAATYETEQGRILLQFVSQLGPSGVGESSYRLLLCQVARGAKDDNDCVVLELHGTANNETVSTETLRLSRIVVKEADARSVRGNKAGVVLASRPWLVGVA